jgi:pimeloyl-ACP methyl ester carboxylesterase
MTATHLGRVAAEAGRDEVVRFGSDDQLVGIVSRGESAGTTSVVLLNAGVLHRIGPHRLHVTLARRLAEIGFPTLRLDLGGIGDSVVSGNAPTFRESAVADTRLAMSGLSASRFIVFGICAGADNALATALADDRVKGIILVDPHVYATRRSQLRGIRKKLAAMGSRETLAWAGRVIDRRVRERVAKFRQPFTDEPAAGREPPPVADYRMQFGALVERGVQILNIYSGIHGAKYNHEDQVFETFPELRGRIDRVFYPHSNHTFTELEAQAELLAYVTSWITTRFR